MERESARPQFHDQLVLLEEQALGALDIVVEQIDRVMEALENQDVELATFVINDDDRIDGRYLEVHQGILSLLALQAPVASDLRLVAAPLFPSADRPRAARPRSADGNSGAGRGAGGAARIPRPRR